MIITISKSVRVISSGQLKNIIPILPITILEYSGRHEINHTQELNYPAIMNAIVETGFKGFVSQEFIPTYDNRLTSLEEGITLCDV